MSTTTHTVTESGQPPNPSFALMMNDVVSPPGLHASRGRTVAIISCITCITAISNLLAGLLTVCIPVISDELLIPPELQLWPASAFALACGCTLLICATVADVLGSRRVLLIGALLQSGSSLGAGLCNTASELIALRALAGVAASLCLPSAVAIASRSFPATTMHKSRSAAFAAMGGGQAVGFGLGLVLGGIFSDTIGWRWGFYTAAILNIVVLALALWALPAGVDPSLNRTIMSHLRGDIDWIGALLISASLALLSYMLAIATGTDAARLMRQPINAVLLCLALALLPAFSLWMRHQENRGRPALLPNSLWKSVPFATVCATVFLVWGALNASEQLAAFYLEDIRGFSTMKSSLYFLPAPICGALMNVAIAVLLPYLTASVAVPVGCFVSGIAPVILASLCRINGPGYWHGVFQAMALNPLGADLIYTIANLVLTDAFPADMQALAGGVFNMLAQVGKSVGIATTAIIAQQITASCGAFDPKEASLQGYKAGWWYNFGMVCTAGVIGIYGLRSVGKLGVKRD
ncbi:Major facilitator superfamily domain protein [Metarhizium brunneum]